MIVAVVVATMLAPAGAQVAPTDKAAPSGFWVGFVDFAGVSSDAAIQPDGTFNMEVLDGEVLGSFQWNGLATTTAAGTVFVDIGGDISGPAEEIELTLTSVVTDGNPVPGGDLGGGAVAWSLVTCERLEGVPTRIDTRADISGISFWAIRSDAARDPAVFFDQLHDLRAQTNELRESFEAGGSGDDLIVSLENTISAAELLAAALERDEFCLDKTYAALLAAEFDALLKWGLEEARLGGIDGATLYRLAMLALASGAFEVGGENYNEGLDGDLFDHLSDEIDAAIALGDTEALIIWWSIAYAVGYELLAGDAMTAIEGSL